MSRVHDDASADIPPASLTTGLGSARKRSWFRFLFQFSLRSLLVVTTLVASACWWYLQPEFKDEPLGGGELRLRRQVRTIALPEAPAQGPAPAASEKKTRLISDGHYRIVDLKGQMLVDGRMSHDRRNGWWTTYYTSGRKAVEGKVVRGERTGLWQTWHESGVLASEVTYRPLSQVDPERLHWQPQAWPGSLREGIARAWFPNGKLKLEGQYASDSRDGTWSYFDEQGQLLERGAYLADRREGEWTIREGASGKLARVVYFRGRTEAEQKQLLAQLAGELKSPDRRAQLNATKKLEELGEAGATILQQGLREGDEITQLLALRTLLRIDQLPEELDGVFRGLIDHPRRPLGQRAMVAAIVLSHRRGEVDRTVLDRLLSEIDANRGASELRVELLQTVCQLDTPDRPEIFSRLVAAVAEKARASPWPDPQTAEAEVFDVMQLDVSPILLQKGDLHALLRQAFGSPEPLVRATVMRAVEQLVELRPPDREALSEAPYGTISRWEIPADLRLLVEQGKSDTAPVVRRQAEAVGVYADVSFGCGFGGLGGVAPGPAPGSGGGISGSWSF